MNAISPLSSFCCLIVPSIWFANNNGSSSFAACYELIVIWPAKTDRLLFPFLCDTCWLHQSHQSTLHPIVSILQRLICIHFTTNQTKFWQIIRNSWCSFLAISIYRLDATTCRPSSRRFWCLIESSTYSAPAICARKSPTIISRHWPAMCMWFKVTSMTWVDSFAFCHLKPIVLFAGWSRRPITLVQHTQCLDNWERSKLIDFFFLSCHPERSYKHSYEHLSISEIAGLQLSWPESGDCWRV